MTTEITNIKSLHRKASSYPGESLKSFARRLAACLPTSSRSRSPSIARRWLANKALKS